MAYPRKVKEDFPWGPVWLGVITSSVVGYLSAFGCASIAPKDNAYGFWLFALIPSVAGISASIVTNWKVDYGQKVGWVISGFAYCIGLVMVLAASIEGLICMAMAAPIIVPLYAMGYFLGAELMAWKRRDFMVTMIPLLLVAMVVNARQTPAAETRTETTSLDIDASPEKISPLLFELPSIDPPAHILFRAGIAHPTATHSAGRFVGAARECVLSTGTMNERIVALEPGKRLKFEVLNTPPPMKELNPFGEVDAPHLHGYYIVHSGEFQLIPLANGRTRLLGTSVYSFKIYPAPYWALWTDTVVEQIHLRVMSEIKARAEAVR